MGNRHSERNLTVQILDRPQNVTFINSRGSSSISQTPSLTMGSGHQLLRAVGTSPEVAMSLLARSVTIEIANTTRDVTLYNPRSYCFSGHSSTPPSPRISPGVTESCRFSNSILRFRGSVGLLVYEAETFTLAILFSNPFDYNLYYVQFAMEISLQKIHLGSLEDTYSRMYHQDHDLHSDATFRKIKLKSCQESITVSVGHVKVMATMSNSRSSIIKVVMLNQDCLTTYIPRRPHQPRAVGLPDMVDKTHPRH